MSRANLSRPPLLWMQRIHEHLAAAKPVNRRTLAGELETSAKTIQRDIDCLRDNFGLPVAYDSTTHSYYYSERVGEVLFCFPLMRPKVTAHSRDDGTSADFTMPLEEGQGKQLATICERYGVRAENVLCAIIGETLADAVCNSRLMDGIVRAARALAVAGKEVA